MNYIQISIYRNMIGEFLEAYGITKEGDKILLSKEEYKDVEELIEQEKERIRKLWYDVCVEDE